MKISEQAITGQKVKRGLVICNGKLLYDFIKDSNPGISVEEINARLKWADVAPLNPDGSEPDDISWKGRSELEKAGYRAMSARDNPNGNGIDLDPPAEIRNAIGGNAWFMERGAPFAIYHAPNERTAKSATAQDLQAKNPAWDFSAGMEKPTFADEGAYDLRTSIQGVGASDDALAWAREQLARLGAKKAISPNDSGGADTVTVESAPLLGLPGWDMSEGAQIEDGVLTIIGSKNEYRAARLILPVNDAMRRGAFAIAGEVKIAGLKPGANPYDCPKFKVYFGESKKDKAQPLLMSSDTADWTPMTLECRLPNPGVSSIMVEVGLQNCQGTFQVRKLAGPAGR
ncbi:MAG: hypothetical protein NTW86_05770 [Candidatus Sumerlaeota bacterium]|nr:hypothetical protein [Candidatus Sumerlaeota bacterium]